jgi:hypothetical protein
MAFFDLVLFHVIDWLMATFSKSLSRIKSSGNGLLIPLSSVEV